MSQTLKINNVTYSEVKEINVPSASDPSKLVRFVDTSEANAVETSIKDGETAFVNGKKVTGSMPVNGAVNGNIRTKDGTVSIPEGYTSGGTVAIDENEKTKLTAGNIRKGITILGVAGSMDSTEGVNPQAREVTPTKSEQVVIPETDKGYNYLSQVTIHPIPAEYITTSDANAEADDIKSGKTAYVKGKFIVGSHTDPAFSLTNGVLSIV
jgi:hypothetical protein